MNIVTRTPGWETKAKEQHTAKSTPCVTTAVSCTLVFSSSPCLRVFVARLFERASPAVPPSVTSVVVVVFSPPGCEDGAPRPYDIYRDGKTLVGTDRC